MNNSIARLILILVFPNVSEGLFHFIRQFKLLQGVGCSLLADGAGGQVLEEHRLGVAAALGPHPARGGVAAQGAHHLRQVAITLLQTWKPNIY